MSLISFFSLFCPGPYKNTSKSISYKEYADLQPHGHSPKLIIRTSKEIREIESEINREGLAYTQQSESLVKTVIAKRISQGEISLPDNPLNKK
jgi:hypothetical protein